MGDIYTAKTNPLPEPDEKAMQDKPVIEKPVNENTEIGENVLEDLKVMAEGPDASKHKILGHTHNPLSAFCYLPDGSDFETRDSEEKVVLILRRHMVTNIPWIVVAVIMVLAPIFLLIVPPIPGFSASLQVLMVLGWYLLTSTYVLEKFLGWFFNVNIITDERIVDIDFYNLIGKKVSDCNIAHIEDVSFTVYGGIRTIFDYGNVLVQTAAEHTNFIMDAVPHPDRVRKILAELQILEDNEERGPR